MSAIEKPKPRTSTSSSSSSSSYSFSSSSSSSSISTSSTSTSATSKSNSTSTSNSIISKSSPRPSPSPSSSTPPNDCLNDATPSEDHRIRVHFVKCPLVHCLEFSLTDAKNCLHLLAAHRLRHRCQASARCVRHRVNFESLSELQEHLKREHGDEGAGTGHHYCHVCQDGPFVEYQALVQHILYVHVEGHYSCAQCGVYSFKYRWKILIHYRRFHRDVCSDNGGDKGDNGGGGLGSHYHHHHHYRRPPAAAVKRRLSEVKAEED